MPRSLITRACLSAVLAALLLGGGACYESEHPLAPPEQAAAADRGYAGDWAVEGSDSERLVVRVTGERQYYVEWHESKSREPSRLIGHVADVKGVPFAQLRELHADGTIGPKSWLMRVERKDDRLTIRQFKESFFNERDVSSAEKLRAVVEQNVENEQMYDETTVAARQANG